MGSAFRLSLILLPAVTGAVLPVSGADDKEKAAIAFFESKIRPALVKHCYECHSEDSKKLGGKLRLDTKEQTLRAASPGPPSSPASRRSRSSSSR